LQRAEGDSLWDLAKKNGSTMSAIMQANALTTEPVPGQMLLIPVV
jgi:LysM repeat protein